MIGTALDIAATLALSVSLGLLVLLFADLLTASLGSAAPLPALASAALFLALLTLPTLWSAIAWPIHLCQKRRGERVFPWLRLVVLASAAWMGLVFQGIGRL